MARSFRLVFLLKEASVLNGRKSEKLHSLILHKNRFYADFCKKRKEKNGAKNFELFSIQWRKKKGERFQFLSFGFVQQKNISLHFRNFPIFFAEKKQKKRFVANFKLI